MAHKLMDLPFAKDKLSPFLSSETLDYHYGKHHQAYVNNLNALLAGTGLEDMPLPELIVTGVERITADKRTAGFNNGAQVYNHNFYWNCLTPGASKTPTGKLSKAIDETFGSYEKFKEAFTKAAVGLFGSGWTWLTKNNTGRLEIVTTSNAGNPLLEKKTPLLTCDVWEHAYYIDYRNARPKYVEAFWNWVNWDFVGKNFA